MNGCCPTCKRKLPVPKVLGVKELNDDLAKASAAMAVLSSAMRWPREHISFYKAVADEYLRLSRATRDYRLLWAIYRRSAKGVPYYQQSEVA